MTTKPVDNQSGSKNIFGPSVKEIVIQWLEASEYDGLCILEPDFPDEYSCSCTLNNPMHCANSGGADLICCRAWKVVGQ